MYTFHILAPGEREGENIGGPLNGDSDRLFDRGADLGKVPDEDSSEDAPDVVPDVACAGGAHAAPGQKEGAPDAALAASLGMGVIVLLRVMSLPRTRDEG